MRFTPDRTPRDQKILGIFSSLKLNVEGHIGTSACPVAAESIKKVMTSGVGGALFVEMANEDGYETYSVFLKDKDSEPSYKLCPVAADFLGITPELDAAFRAKATKYVQRD